MDFYITHYKKPYAIRHVDCQLGRGRSTLTQVIIILVQQWLRAGAKRKTFADFVGEGKRASYQIINNLLRVVRNGKEVKAAVDTAITQCNEVVDLFNEIEDSRLTAEEAAQNGSTKPEEDATERGINLLRRYFFLCQFASYLNETDGENTRALRDVQSFKNFVAQRPGEYLYTSGKPGLIRNASFSNATK